MAGGIYTVLFLFVFLLGAAAFFSMAEVVYSSERRRLLHTVKKTDPTYKLLTKPERFFATILILNNVANVSMTAIITYEVAGLFGPEGVFISTIFVTISIIVGGEILPKVWAIRNSQDVAKIVLKIISVHAKLMYPIIFPFEKLVRGMAEEELKSYIPIEMFEREQVNMVKGIAKLAELELKDLMIPRSRVACLDIKMPIEDVIELIKRTKHTRYPVLSDGKVVGILLSKNLMLVIGPGGKISVGEKKSKDEEGRDDIESSRDGKSSDTIGIANIKLEDVIRENPDILRPPRLAPPNKSALEQLKDFKKWRTHLVCIINDFGEFEGIVTLEDIIEEIIGDIKDEYSYPSELFWKSGNIIYARGEAPIRDINREFGLNIDDRFLTIFSTIVSTLGRIPEPGEKITFDGWEIEVVDSSKTKIELVKLIPLKKNEGEKMKEEEDRSQEGEKEKGNVLTGNNHRHPEGENEIDVAFTSQKRDK